MKIKIISTRRDAAKTAFTIFAFCTIHSCVYTSIRVWVTWEIIRKYSCNINFNPALSHKLFWYMRLQKVQRSFCLLSLLVEIKRRIVTVARLSFYSDIKTINNIEIFYDNSKFLWKNYLIIFLYYNFLFITIVKPIMQKLNCYSFYSVFTLMGKNITKELSCTCWSH